MRINPGAINTAPTGNVGGALMRPGRGKNIITFRTHINPVAINGVITFRTRINPGAIDGTPTFSVGGALMRPWQLIQCRSVKMRDITGGFYDPARGQPGALLMIHA